MTFPSFAQVNIFEDGKFCTSVQRPVEFTQVPNTDTLLLARQSHLYKMTHVPIHYRLEINVRCDYGKLDLLHYL